MAIDKSRLAAIIGNNAKGLCSASGSRLVNEKIASKHNKVLDDPDPASYNDGDYYDNMYLSESSHVTSTVNDMYYDNTSLSKSKMPEFIKESLANNTINMTGSGGISVTDGMGIPKKNTKQPLTEGRPVTPAYAPQTLNIDYSIIKAIVNECLKEYFEKEVLNESATLKTIGLQEGNISLVDNKGNIYKAKLEKIGNKNDKK